MTGLPHIERRPNQARPRPDQYGVHMSDEADLLRSAAISFAQGYANRDTLFEQAKRTPGAGLSHEFLKLETEWENSNMTDADLRQRVGEILGREG